MRLHDAEEPGGPGEARKLLDPVLEPMMEAVLVTATAMCGEMDMRFWLAQAGAELKKSG
jgi:hypothetical protein